MLGRKVLIYGGFCIVRGGRGAKLELTAIAFGEVLELVEAFGKLSSADDQQPCGHRIERTSMADFDFFDPKFILEFVSNFIDYIKGGPTFRFIDQEHFARGKIVLGEFFVC